MRIYKYIMEHKLAFLAIVLCFVVQACCELSLPRYTSDIVDVGIQQSGIENPSPEVISSHTYDTVRSLSASIEDEELIIESYDWEAVEGYYQLNKFGKDNRESLDKAMTLPMVYSYYGKSLDGASDEIIAQQALLAARAEYETCGIDISEVQMNYLINAGIIMLILAAIALISHCVMNYFCCKNSTKIARDLRSRFFKRVVEFSDAEVDKFSSASLITRGTNDIQQIQMVCMMAQRMVIYTVVICTGAIIMVARTNVSMSWIIGLAVIVIFIVIGILFAITMPKFKKMQILIDKVNQVSREILTGLPVIRAFNREDFELDRFQKANADLMGTQLFTNRAMSFMMPVMMLVMNVVSVAIVWVGGHYVDLGTVQTGDLIAFITYSTIIVVSFLMVGLIAIILPRANVAAARVDEVIETASSIQDALEIYDQQLSDEPGARVEFQDVCFRYSDGSKNVLDHVSFVAPAGKTTAIIGSTGSGKSTIVRLIERFYDVSEGAVKVDGVDVRDLSQKALHGVFGYVPQQAFLFSGTIESNVSYGCESPQQEVIDWALDIAQAADFVAEKPLGVKEPIAQGGGNVSGGQRQRLSIARALAVDARAYLFDDSFSALDYKTDAKLRHELETRLAGRTLIIVAQRISTIMHADQIVVLDEGRVVGLGTHQQLLQGCEAYREIALSQLSEEELAKGGVA